MQAARAQLDAVRAKKDQMEAKLAELETQLEAVRLGQQDGKFQIDEGQAERLEAALKDLEEQVRLAGKKADSSAGPGQDAAPEKKAPSEDGLKEIDAHCGQDWGNKGTR